MPPQKESPGIRHGHDRPLAPTNGTPVPDAKRPRRNPAWLLGGAGLVLALGLSIGVSVNRARTAHLPPSLAWSGPDPTSSTRETEVRVSEAARRAPAALQAQVDLAQFYLDDARPFEALWALQEARHLDPKALKPRLMTARALAMGQLYPAAVTLLQATVREHPSDSEAPEELADLQLSLGRPAEAAATLAALASRQLLTGSALLLHGRALEAAGRYPEALEQYQRYQQQDPRAEQAYLHIGKLMLRMDKPADAGQAFQAAQILNARSAEARYYLGLIELRGGPTHEEAARQKFAEAVAASDEKFAPAHVQLGAYYQRRRDWGHATAVLQRAFELDAENADALLHLSRVRRAMGDLSGASYYQGLYYDVKDARPRATAQYEAMAASGDDPRAPLLVSNGYIKMDQKQRAIQAARRGLQRHPGEVNLTERLIALDMLTSNLQEAEQLCQEWATRDPSAVQPTWLLGRIAMARKQYDVALRSFEQAAKAEPQNAEYQFWLGSFYAERLPRPDWDRAVRYYGQAVTLKPDDARYRLNLGVALQKQGDLEGARRQLLRSMDLDSNQSAPLNNLVQIARSLNQPAQVAFWAPLVRDVEQRLRIELPAWKRVWDSPMDADGYLPLARFLTDSGELGKARNVLEQAIALRPDLPTARRDLQVLSRTLDVM
jgi:tetratricopeptide (TPR) repeat protein